MSKKWKDTDYLFISTYLRALETRLLTRERRTRMLEARTDEDAAKVLSECGYTDLEPLTAQALETSLKQMRDSTFAELAELSPNGAIVDVFRMKYDYHNAKALVKCQVTKQDPQRMLVDAGRVSPKQLEEVLSTGEPGEVPSALVTAVAAAREVLNDTDDPQRSDFSLDQAYFQEMLDTARAAGSDFLVGYVQLMIDAANLRAAVRSMRMQKDLDFLASVLMEGGTVPVDQIAGATISGGSLEALFTGPLQSAAALGDQIASGGSQTAFERACDDALNTFLQESRMVPFGDGVLIAYAAAVENDVTAARIILSGRLSGVPTESIRERLREAYV